MNETPLISKKTNAKIQKGQKTVVHFTCFWYESSVVFKSLLESSVGVWLSILWVMVKVRRIKIMRMN